MALLTYMVISFFKIISSFVVAEEGFVQGLRIVSFLSDCLLCCLVFKGFDIARIILATLMTTIGGYTLLVALTHGVSSLQHMVFIITGLLWTPFGLLLFFLKRFNKETAA